MTIQIEFIRPAATIPVCAPVAMQRGGHDDRMVLARLRLQRRWLLRDRATACVTPEHPPARRAAAGDVHDTTRPVNHPERDRTSLVNNKS